MRLIRWLIIGVTGSLFFLLITLFTLRSVLLSERLEQRPVIDPGRGIDELFAHDIGGVAQWFHVRGQDRGNPIVLFVHGGPGSPKMPSANTALHPLETDFTIVQWDQRGAGKSALGVAPEAADFELMMSDAIAAVEMLLQRYDKDKLTLMGHSYGTMLGHAMMMRRPELFQGFIGIGVLIDTRKSDLIAVEMTRRRATAAGDDASVEQLNQLEAVIADTDNTAREFLDAIIALRQIQSPYGLNGSYKDGDIYWPVVWEYIGSPEYTIRDLLGLLDPVFAPKLFNDVRHFKAENWGTDFRVPVIYLLGRHDGATPSDVAADFLKQRVTAPYKKIYWFENSAHMPSWDEPDKFTRVVQQALLRVTTDPVNLQQAAP